METVLLIDGENLKGKIKDVFKEAKKEKIIWHEYDFKGLFIKVLDRIQINRKVFYFARLKEHESSKEKGVDVKIAVDMVSLSCDKKVKEIILCSSDSDLQPAIEEAEKRAVNCVYIGFEVNPNKGISYTIVETFVSAFGLVMSGFRFLY